MVVEHKSRNGGIQGLISRIEALKHKQLYVGIPQEKASRKEEPINNPSLLYIHTHGSVLKHIPARPVIEPAIEYHKDKIAEQFAKVVKAKADNNDERVARAMIRTGELTAGYCRGWFRNPANGWPPNSPLTIASKGSDRPLIDTGSLRKSITYVIKED